MEAAAGGDYAIEYAYGSYKHHTDDSGEQHGLHTPLQLETCGMASVTRSAKATWAGSNRQGRGTLSTESGTLNQTRYAFDSRFVDAIGTNPEELIAAAHAGCFNMSLAYRLGSAGYEPTLLTTTARVKLTQDASGWHISRVDLVLEAVIPGIDFELFSALATEAKSGCAISRSIKAEVTLTTALTEASEALPS